MTDGIRTAARWLALITLVAAWAPPARAADAEMGDVLVNGFYGGLIGALVGAAVMALTDDPGEHTEYLLTGAGIGVIAGTVYGVSQVVRHAMIEVDRGEVSWHVPPIEPAVSLVPDATPELTVSAAIVRLRF